MIFDLSETLRKFDESRIKEREGYSGACMSVKRIVKYPDPLSIYSSLT